MFIARNNFSRLAARLFPHDRNIIQTQQPLCHSQSIHAHRTYPIRSNFSINEQRQAGANGSEDESRMRKRSDIILLFLAAVAQHSSWIRMITTSQPSSNPHPNHQSWKLEL